MRDFFNKYGLLTGRRITEHQLLGIPKMQLSADFTTCSDAQRKDTNARLLALFGYRETGPEIIFSYDSYGDVCYVSPRVAGLLRDHGAFVDA